MSSPLTVLLQSLLGVALNGLLLWGVWGPLRLFRAGDRADITADEPSHVLDRVAAITVVAGATIVIVVTAGGLLGVLNRPLVLLGLTALAALLLRRIQDRGGNGWTKRSGPASPCPREVGIAATIVFVTWIPLFAERIMMPPVAWDALTYHLHFPVMWLQEGALVTASAPVGDPSNPYFPLAGEMLLYWMLLSTGTDLWASFAQMPMALAGAAIVAWLSIRCGASRALGAVAGLCWVATPGVLRQSVDPMVDVQLATWWLLTIYALVRWRDGSRGSWLPVAGASAGLLIGTKYSGLVFLAALAPLAIHLLRERLHGGGAVRAADVAVALLLMVIVGGFAYVRNAVNGGNPLLPLELRLAGSTIAPGIVGGDYYFGSDAPRLSWSQLFLSARALLDAGPAFLVVLLSLPAAFLLGKRARFRAWLAMSALLAFLASAVLMPYREHRYFFPVLAVAWSVLASMASARELMALRAGLVLILVTAPLTLFYWGKDLVLAGFGAGHAAAAVLALLFVSGVVWLRSLARLRVCVARVLATRAGRIQAAALMGVLAVLVLAGTSIAYVPGRYERWARYWASRHEWERPEEPRADFRDMGASWQILADETRARPAVIAYAGMNAPYPMTGFSFANPVRFVPRGENPLASDYDWGSKPVDCREPGSMASWMENLERTRVQYLCVYRIASATDPDPPFPVEREWADRAPEAFRLVWSSEYARIYRRSSAVLVPSVSTLPRSSS